MAIEEWNFYKPGETSAADIKRESRYLLVGMINRELAVRLQGKKPSEECMDDLDLLISHYNTGVNCSSYEYFRQYAPQIQNALLAIMFNTRAQYAARVFRKLLNAVNPTKRTDEEILVSNGYITLDGRYNDIFAFAQMQLMTAGQAGAGQACKDILSCLERPDIPLFGYSDVVAAKMGNGTNMPNGTCFYTLPTKVEKVDTKYSYAPGHRYPAVSLVVKPFE